MPKVSLDMPKEILDDLKSHVESGGRPSESLDSQSPLTT